MANQLEGGVVVADLVSEHAEEVQRTRVRWIGSEDNAVKGFGLLKLAAAVVVEGGLKGGVIHEP